MLNKFTGMGRLAKDMELLSTASGRHYIHNTIAIDRDGTGRGDTEKVTDWLDITAWGKTAEFIARWFQKGDPILLEGSIRTATWTGRDGKKRYSTELNVDSAYFCGSKRRDPAPAAELTDLDGDTSDLPFKMDDDEKAPWEDEELPL